MELNEYHHRDGWYFKRLDDGRVRIRKSEEPYEGSNTEFQIFIPANEWDSIVKEMQVK